MNSTRRFGVAFALPFSCALFLLGCGGANTGTLSGTVTYKGKSVKTGTVTVFDSGKVAHQGPIEDGKYTVANVPYGDVKLIVMSPNPGAGDGVRDRDGGRDAGKRPADSGKPAEGWFPIPAKYGDVDKAGLKTTISAKTNDYPITLTDDR